MNAPYVVRWVACILWAIPAPTAAWASIIGSLAWPITIAVLIFRFRRYIRIFLNTVADRLVTDHVKIGPFELTPNSQVIRLDGDDTPDDSEYAPDDLHRMEQLFEFIADPSGDDRLRSWVGQRFNSELELVEFLMDPAYADDRAQAVRDLIGEEG